MRDSTIAGSPLKRSMIVELTRRAAEAGEGAAPEDVVCALVASGETLIEVARRLEQDTGLPISPGIVGAWMNADPKRKAALAEARKQSAPILAEQAMEILDDVDEDRDAIAKAKAQADLRTWLASKYDRQTFGNDAAQVNVQLNLGQLHLDALRQRAAITATTAPMLPPAGPDYETVTDA